MRLALWYSTSWLVPHPIFAYSFLRDTYHIIKLRAGQSDKDYVVLLDCATYSTPLDMSSPAGAGDGHRYAGPYFHYVY
jgi:hypothetical protein